jgi:hypothetical protein
MNDIKIKSKVVPLKRLEEKDEDISVFFSFDTKAFKQVRETKT